MRLPGGSARGRRSEVTRSIDVFPTLLELVGIEPIPGLVGRSLVPLLGGDGDDWFTATAALELVHTDPPVRPARALMRPLVFM